MNRDQLAKLRPFLPGLQLEGTKSMESFQNDILRPIIKFQHAFIESYFRNNVQFQFLLKDKGPRLEFQEKVKRFIGNQTSIKNQLIGSIIGLLTESELTYYWKESSEINKRISQMICQRVSDTFY